MASALWRFCRLRWNLNPSCSSRITVELVVEPLHLVAADRLGEALHLDRGLLLGGDFVLDQRIRLMIQKNGVHLPVRFTALPIMV